MDGALLGMVIKYSEVLLAVKYRERDARGDWVGGPMYYIKNGMGDKWKWLAGAFSVLAALAAFGIGNMSQANSIVGSVTDAVCREPRFRRPGGAALGARHRPCAAHGARALPAASSASALLRKNSFRL